MDVPSAELGHLRQERQEPTCILLHVPALAQLPQQGNGRFDAPRTACVVIHHVAGGGGKAIACCNQMFANGTDQKTN